MRPGFATASSSRLPLGCLDNDCLHHCGAEAKGEGLRGSHGVSRISDCGTLPAQVLAAESAFADELNGSRPSPEAELLAADAVIQSPDIPLSIVPGDNPKSVDLQGRRYASAQ